MKNYLMGWNFIRLVRLALGIFIVVQGILTKEWTFVALGAVFSLMPLFNIGCCGTSCCSTTAGKPIKMEEKKLIDEKR